MPDKMSYILKDLCSCSVGQQLEILDIRNQPGVRESDHIIGVNEYLAWISWLEQEDKYKNYAILKDGEKPVGIVSIDDMDRQNRKADWTLCLDEETGGGLDVALEYVMLDHVFKTLDFDKLNCEVVATKPVVVKRHKKFGFEDEGYRKSHIVRGRERIGVHLLGMQKDKWLGTRDDMGKAIAKDVGKFDIDFAAEVVKDQESPLSLIQKARAKNNVNWMALLRLSVEHHPHIAKPIISEILRLDTEISELTKRLVE